MLRREVVQHDDAAWRNKLERSLALGTHLRRRAALPAAAVEEEKVERRLRGQDLVPVAVEDAHLRMVREQTLTGGGTLVVGLDGDEGRLGPHRGRDPRGADTGSGPDLSETCARPGRGKNTEQPADFGDRGALEPHRHGQRFRAVNELGGRLYDGVTR